MTVRFVSGPLDGFSRTVTDPAVFLFVDTTKPHEVACTPVDGRLIYKAVGENAYAFIGYTHMVCRCGKLRRRRGRCPHCGVRVEPASA